jgi:uncharacterized protein (TIGR03437 family)
MPSHYYLLRAGLIAALAAAILPAATDRITTRIDSSRVRVLRGSVHPKTRQGADLGLADPAFPIAHGMLLLQPADGLEPFLTELQTPGSPNFHRWLTPEEFGAKFGASGNDRAKLVAWLESQGLRIETVARGGQWIGFSGSAATVGRAFRTEIHRYSVNGKTHFANSSELSVPLALEKVVSGFHGLDNFSLTPQLRRLKTAPNATDAKGVHNLAPDDLAAIYNLSALYAAGVDGTGQTVAVVGQTNVDLADIRTFRQRFHLPPNDPKVMLFGPSPGTVDADEPEADLDLEWAGAVARNAQIVYVNSSDVVSSVFYAIDNNVAPVISMSYGGCEIENTPDLRTFAQQANAQGITWVVSSGDAGAAGCDFTAPTPQASKGRSVSFPASIPEVTSIGGTSLNEGAGTYWTATNGASGASALSYIPETAWNDSVSRNELSATGGGASTFYPKPFWQSAPGVPADGARDVPDISFAASPDHDGYLVQAQGSQTIFGGTSVGTPVFAGLVGLLNQYLAGKNVISQPGLGNVNPVLYRLAQAAPAVYHDVTEGDNFEPCAQATPDCVNGALGYKAGPGYDLVTGLGSVDAWQLAKQWTTGVTSTTSLVATPASATLTDTITLTATVTSAGTSRPTGTVLFLSSYNSLGTVNLVPGPGSTATATLAVPMVRIAEGSGSVSVLYSGNGVVEGSGSTAFVNLQIPTGGSLVVPSVDPNPVYQSGNLYQYTVTLQEVAGVATKVTGFTFDGSAVSLSLLPRTNLAAFGFIQTTLANGTGITPTAGSHVFGFTGQDANGKTWSQSVTATFLPSSAPFISPSILLTSVPSKVFPNPSADPGCQWVQQLTLQEQGGFLTNLTQFSIGSTNLTSQIGQYFGTTRLAPYGILYGNFCWNSANVTPSKTFTIGGVGEIGTVSSVATATYSTAPPAAAASFSLSAASFVFTAADSSQVQTGSIDLAFTGGDSVWTVSTLPANFTTRWLTVTPNSGSGPGRVTLRASAAGLSPGVYRAYLTFQTTNAFPEAINVPVTLVTGASGSLSIGGISNAASFGATGAPGAEMRVIGLNLAPSAAQAAHLPLPLSLNGVSATVNGVTAPLYSVDTGQVNVQVPYETAPGTAVLAINNNGKIAWQDFSVAIAAPGIFATPTRSLVPVSSAQVGDAVTLYMTGAGDLTPSVATGDGIRNGDTVTLSQTPHPRLPVAVTVGGVSAPVLFRGIPKGTAGITQVNFTVPDGVPTGVQPVVVTVGGLSGPPVNLTVLPGSMVSSPMVSSPAVSK